jgi:hypothetical protein
VLDIGSFIFNYLCNILATGRNICKSTWSDKCRVISPQLASVTTRSSTCARNGSVVIYTPRLTSRATRYHADAALHPSNRCLIGYLRSGFGLWGCCR